MELIELVIEDPDLGLQRITGRIEPPQVRRGDLRQITFGVREPAS